MAITVTNHWDRDRDNYYAERDALFRQEQLAHLEKIARPTETKGRKYYTKEDGSRGWRLEEHRWEYPWHNYRRCTDEKCERREWYYSCERRWLPSRPYDMGFDPHLERPPAPQQVAQ